MTDKGIWNSHTLGTAPRRESVEEYFDWKRDNKTLSQVIDEMPEDERRDVEKRFSEIMNDHTP